MFLHGRSVLRAHGFDRTGVGPYACHAAHDVRSFTERHGRAQQFALLTRRRAVLPALALTCIVQRRMREGTGGTMIARPFKLHGSHARGQRAWPCPYRTHGTAARRTRRALRCMCPTHLRIHRAQLPGCSFHGIMIYFFFHVAQVFFARETLPCHVAVHTAGSSVKRCNTVRAFPADGDAPAHRR